MLVTDVGDEIFDDRFKILSISPPELNEIEENESDSNSMPFSMTLRSRKK